MNYISNIILGIYSRFIAANLLRLKWNYFQNFSNFFTILEWMTNVWNNKRRIFSLAPNYYKTNLKKSFYCFVIYQISIQSTHLLWNWELLCKNFSGFPYRNSRKICLTILQVAWTNSFYRLQNTSVNRGCLQLISVRQFLSIEALLNPFASTGLLLSNFVDLKQSWCLACNYQIDNFAKIFLSYYYRSQAGWLTIVSRKRWIRATSTFQ